MDDLRKPILPGKGASDYERYLRTDELLSLQKTAEEFLHPDEMTFQVVHQASELLLKGVAWELDRARALIASGNFSNAAQLLRRGNHMLEFPISMLHVLETITPVRLSPDSRRARTRQRAGFAGFSGPAAHWSTPG